MKNIISFGIAIAVIAGVYLYESNRYGSQLKFDGNDVYYTGDVSKEEAEKLGKHLQGYFFTPTSELSVQLCRSDGKLQFRMVVIEDYKNSDVYPLAFQAMHADLTRFFDGPLEFHLTDDGFKTLEVLEKAQPADSEKAAAAEQTAAN